MLQLGFQRGLVFPRNVLIPFGYFLSWLSSSHGCNYKDMEQTCFLILQNAHINHDVSLKDVDQLFQITVILRTTL